MVAELNTPGTGDEAFTLGINEAFERENGRIKRRVDRFRRAGMFSDGATLTIHQATTAEELAEAYRLVHDVFTDRKYILPQPGGMRIRTYEALPEMATFVAKTQGRVVAVMSAVPDTDEFGLPSDKAFADELDGLRAQKRKLCEITNLAVDASYRNGAIFPEMTRVILADLWTKRHLDDAFIAISEEHAIFFESVLGFEPFGDRRNYGGDTEDYVVGRRVNRGMGERLRRTDQALGDSAFLHDWYLTQNPYFDQVGKWRETARAEFLNPSLLSRLFVEQSGFLGRCNGTELAGLRRHWGSDLLDQVRGDRQTAVVHRLAA